jgi:hypothetical protein
MNFATDIIKSFWISPEKSRKIVIKYCSPTSNSKDKELIIQYIYYNFEQIFYDKFITKNTDGIKRIHRFLIANPELQILIGKAPIDRPIIGSYNQITESFIEDTFKHYPQGWISEQNFILSNFFEKSYNCILENTGKKLIELGIIMTYIRHSYLQEALSYYIKGNISANIYHYHILYQMITQMKFLTTIKNKNKVSLKKAIKAKNSYYTYFIRHRDLFHNIHSCYNANKTLLKQEFGFNIISIFSTMFNILSNFIYDDIYSANEEYPVEWFNDHIKYIDNCYSCLEENITNSIVFYPCKHSICKTCFYNPHNNKYKCGMCRSRISHIL